MSKTTESTIRVLFLCTGNSCRSQMAEGWGRFLHGAVAEFRSAGIAPGKLDPRAVKVMAEVGVDITSHWPKSLDELRQERFDLIVTVCDTANESCPVFPGTARKIHRDFTDPPRLAAGVRGEEEALNCYRRVRDEIREFVENLPKEWRR